MNRTATQRRVLAASLLALNLFGVVVAPFVHSFVDHALPDSKALAERIDSRQFRDPTSGLIDLDRLAVALKLGDHDGSKPHSHGAPGQAPTSPANHGAGAIEHAGIAVLAAAHVIIIPVRAAELPPEPVPAEAPAPTLALRHLKAQRSQAPPSDVG